MDNLDNYDGKYVVYLLTSPSGKQYCGYSSNIKRRWKSASQYEGCPKIYNAIQKYGWNNIRKEIIYVFDNKELALQKERQVIKEKNLIQNGYNSVEGGNEPPHGLQYISTEGYKKMQQNGKRLAEQIKNNTELKKYTIQRMREENHKARMTMTPEQRKLSYGARNIGRIPVNAKPIYQIDKDTDIIIAEFQSAGLAADALGNREYSQNIRRTANGKGKTAYGYKWRWKE